MQTTAARIIHDFCPRIDEVRDSALASGFGTWAPNKGEVGSSIYTGMSFWGLHSLMLHALARAMGQPVFPNNMFFRVTNTDTEKAYVHSDRESGTHTCVAYLSEHHDEVSGTGFYRHKETGMLRMPSFNDLRTDPEFFERLKKEMVEGNEEQWDLMDFVRGEYNKAVIFDAPLFHARHPKGGIGSTPEDGRMVWVAHFRILGPNGELST
jgi:hypothetical protein